MKVGDLVMCKDDNYLFASGIDAGTGLIIHMEQYKDCATGLSVCVQWADDYLWYTEKDLEVVSRA